MVGLLDNRWRASARQIGRPIDRNDHLTRRVRLVAPTSWQKKVFAMKQFHLVSIGINQREKATAAPNLPGFATGTGGDPVAQLGGEPDDFAEAWGPSTRGSRRSAKSDRSVPG